MYDYAQLTVMQKTGERRRDAETGDEGYKSIPDYTPT